MKPGLRLYMIPKHGPLIITDCLPNNYQMVTMATEGTSTPALELSGAHGVKLPSWRAKPVSSVSQWPGSWLWDPLGPSPPQGEQVSVTVPSQLTVLNKIIAPTAGQKTRWGGGISTENVTSQKDYRRSLLSCWEQGKVRTRLTSWRVDTGHKRPWNDWARGQLWPVRADGTRFWRQCDKRSRKWLDHSPDLRTRVWRCHMR